MIPLNKPKIYNRRFNDKLISSKVILKSIYNNQNVELVFSARQGLDLIYKEIYRKYGSCRVAVSPLTCFEALYPIIYNNHSLHFIDINSQTFNMDEKLIPKEIDVIQAIHFGGNPQNMDILVKKAEESSAIIVEDCAQAFGSTYKNIPLGNFGNFSSFSFSKNLYALAGGFILSNSKIDIPEYKKAEFRMIIYKVLKRFFETRNSYKTGLNEFLLLKLLKLKPEFTSFIFSKYTINKTIFNSITKQLNNHIDLINNRKKIAKDIKNKISNKNLVEQKIINNGDSSYTRLLYMLKEGDSRGYISKLREKKIWANHLSQNTLSYFQPDVFQINEFKDYAKKSDLINYKRMHNKIISFPISPALNRKEIDYLINQINEL